MMEAARSAEPDSGNANGDARAFWDVPVPGGVRQVWIQRKDAFEAVRIGSGDGGAPDIRLSPATPALLAGQLRAARVPACGASRRECPRLLPATFAFCPFCGAAAIPPPPPPDDGPAAPAWSSAGGTAIVPAALHAPEGAPDTTVEPAIRGVLPSGGPFLFAMAGVQPVTLALDTAGGDLWRPDAGEWRRVDTVDGRCSLPAWSRAAAALGTGLVLPLDEGALWLDAGDPLGRRLRSSPARSVGGASAGNGVAMVPVLTAGRLAVAWITDAATRSGGVWSLADVAGDGVPDAVTLGKPLPAAAGGAVWAGIDGFLAVRPGAEGPVAVWRNWPEGQRALPWNRPHLGDHGVAHQLVRTADGGGYRAVALPVPNAAGALPESLQGVALDGPFASTGDTAFHQHRRYGALPWQRDATDFAQPGQLVLPIMTFRSGSGHRAVRQILFATTTEPAALIGGADGMAPAEPSRLTLFLHRPGHDRALLLSGLAARTVHDLQPFLLDGQLCLYDEGGASWHRWTSLVPRPSP